MSERMVLYVLPIVLGATALLPALVARWEKRMVWPYGPLQAAAPYGDASGYGSRWVGEARRLGFDFLGWAPDLKGPKYRLSYAFLVSPERDCLVIVGVGTLVGFQLAGTWIHTLAAGGGALYSTDNPSCVEFDVARRWKGQLARVRTFGELLRRHRDLLRGGDVRARPFSPGRELDEWRNLRQERFQAMAHQGLIELTDASGAYWRYTLSGALRWSALSYAIGLARGLTLGRFPKLA